MSQKLTLALYLRGRGEIKSLTRIEAEALGVPYPLVAGWPARYGAVEITQAMLQDLSTRVAGAKRSSANKARRGLNAAGAMVTSSQGEDCSCHQTQNGINASRLMALALDWELCARTQCEHAERTSDEMAARLARHRASCYYNCAAEIRCLLNAEVPLALPIRGKR